MVVSTDASMSALRLLTQPLPFCSSPSRSPLLHPALSNSLSRSFGFSSPFSLSALSSSLTMLSSSPSFSSMGMSLGRSFEERPQLEAQFFRNFSCCGLDLQDLHGLLEHFEECHVAFDDADSQMADGMDMDTDNASDGTISGPPSPRIASRLNRGSSGELKKSLIAAAGGLGASHDHLPPSPLMPGGNDLPSLDAGMDLDMEMDDDVPPYASTSSLSPAIFASVPPMSAFDSSSSANSKLSKKFSTAMNPSHTMRNTLVFDPRTVSGGFPSDPSQLHHSHPGTPLGEETTFDVFGAPTGGPALSPHAGLAPCLLFPGTGNEANSGAGTPVHTPPSDDESGPDNASSSGRDSKDLTSGHPSFGHTLLLGQAPHFPPLATLASPLHPLGTGVQISPSGRPYTPPSEKPFKCSVLGCDKSYKQQNGLKYHRLHGHCNQNNVGREGEKDRGEGKPYVCHVTSCGKRYKNMNGLRYHYQHSGAHGALGLQMLAQACHPPPQFPPGHKRSAGESGNTSRAGSPVPSSGGGPSRDTSPAGLMRSGSSAIAIA